MNITKRPGSRAPSTKTLRRGAAVVEFALTVPILILLVMGAIEFSRANVLINSAKIAASEGARQGIIIGKTAADIEAVIRNELSMVGVAYAEVMVRPAVVTDDTKLVTIGVCVPLDQRNGYVTPKYFVGDFVFRVTAMPRESKNAPAMNQLLATSIADMQLELEQASLDPNNISPNTPPSP